MFSSSHPKYIPMTKKIHLCMSIYGVCTQSTIMWKNKVFLIDQKLWRILKKWNLRMKEGATDYSVKWRVAPKADTKGRHTRNWKEPWGSSVVTGWIHQHEQLGSSILLYLLLQDPTAPQFMPRSEQQWGPPWDGICGFRGLGLRGRAALWEAVNMLELRETPQEDELLAHPATILKSQT